MQRETAAYFEKKYGYKRLEPIEKGWSSDKKYRAEDSGGAVYLLRITPAGKDANRREMFEMTERVAALGIPMSRPLHFGTCAEGTYSVYEWIDGEDLETVLAELPVRPRAAVAAEQRFRRILGGSAANRRRGKQRRMKSGDQKQEVEGKMKYVFGADIGGTTVKLGLFQADGALLEKWEIPTVIEDEGEAVLRDVTAAVENCMARRGIDRADVLGIGAGIPGPVTADGTVNRCVNLGWGVFNVSEALARISGFPVESANDANVAALGEYWMGGGKGCRDMLFVTLGTGVGGAVIADGKLIAGAHGAGGELGHMVINRDEPEACACGRHGCVQQYASATGIVRVAKQYLDAHPDAASAMRGVDKLTAKAVFDCAAAGDAAAKAALETVYDAFGFFLAAGCTVSDPEAVVIGGGVSRAGAPLLEGVRQGFLKYAFYPNRDVRFALASLGNDAGIYGCCKLILDRFG